MYRFILKQTSILYFTIIRGEYKKKKKKTFVSIYTLRSAQIVRTFDLITPLFLGGGGGGERERKAHLVGLLPRCIKTVYDCNNACLTCVAVYTLTMVTNGSIWQTKTREENPYTVYEQTNLSSYITWQIILYTRIIFLVGLCDYSEFTRLESDSRE